MAQTPMHALVTSERVVIGMFWAYCAARIIAFGKRKVSDHMTSM